MGLKFKSKQQVHIPLGTFLRVLRKDLGFNQAQMAMVLDVDPQTISRWERAECDCSWPSKLVWIFQHAYRGCSVEWLKEQMNKVTYWGY